MKTNLITRLKEEWNNLDPVDPLRGLIANAIDALTQPAQPSKPLTDEKISNLWCDVSNTDFVTADTHEFARAIEAAHGIKE